MNCIIMPNSKGLGNSMVTLAQSSTYLRDREATRLRIVENVRQSSAFEGVKDRVRQVTVRPRVTASAKKSAKAS